MARKPMPISTNRPNAEASDWAEKLERLTAANETLLDAFDKQLQREQNWQIERELFREMIDQVPDYLFVKDRESRFVIANKAVAADLGATPDALIGRTDLELHPPALAAKFFADEQEVITNEEPMLDIEEFVILTTGTQRWLSTSKLPLRDGTGKVIGIVGISRDITDRKRAEAQIQHMAHHDSLTGLPNRTLLINRLEQSIAAARRDGTSIAVVFVDLDRFKLVNDSRGHRAGDTLLKTIADRMIRSVRATDTVGRLSGDEFVIILDKESENDQGRISDIVERLQAAVAEPVTTEEGHVVQVSCSIGIARYPNDADNPEGLITNADLAMYQAKERGRGMSAWYSASMNAKAIEHRKLEEGLRIGLRRGEFYLVYQPQIDLTTGRVRGIEALLRWRHPELGLVMPANFIPVAEETGVIVELGDWVMKEACRQNAEWQRAGLGPVPVAVNVSARQFRDGDFVRRVTTALEEAGLDPRYLELELTESLLMENVEEAALTMAALERLGIAFSIDDFGTGYSSLSALKSFPISHLKIDRSFIENLSRDSRDRSIAQAVISMAKKLRLRVIAEGVENHEQLAFLKANLCDEAQGFLISEPVAADKIAAILDNARPWGKTTFSPAAT